MDLAELAHELNNPLTMVLANVDLLREQFPYLVQHDQAELVALLADIQGGAHRLRDVVAALCSAGARSPGPCSLAGVVTATLGLSQRALLRRGVELVVHPIASTLVVLGVEGDLVRLLTNLLLNAAEAGATRITLRGCCLGDQAKPADLRVRLLVDDNGKGIAKELLAHVFDPGVSTKGSGGLGLSICRQICTEHGGDLVIAQKPEGGTTLLIHLPLYAPPKERRALCREGGNDAQ